MYIFEISNIAGEEVWYSEPGWYFTNEQFTFVGPFKTESLAIEAYAWHVNAIFDRIMDYDRAMNSPGLVVPDRKIIQ